MKLKKWIVSGLMVLAFGTAHAQLKEGVDYTKLSKPITQANSHKIEVLEFFAYFCPHCEHLEPVLLENSRKWDKDTYLRKEHVVWKDSDLNLARISSAISASGLVYQASPAVFKALFNDRINLGDPQLFEQWAKSQTFGKDLLRAYHSPTNMADAQRMQKLTRDYQIGSVPSLIVGGRYQLNLSNDYAQSMAKLNELIDKVRQERGMKKTADNQATIKTKGLELATKAAQ